jgi:PAS domain S-box-containing protein
MNDYSLQHISRDQLKDILTECGHEALLICQDGRLAYVSGSLTVITGFSEEEIRDIPLSLFLTGSVTGNYQEKIRDKEGSSPPNSQYYIRVTGGHGVVRDMKARAFPVYYESGPATMIFINSVTETNNAPELFLSICTECGRIRGDDGSWEPLDESLRGKFRLRFSHTLCPGCAEALYGDKKWFRK